MRDNLPLYIAQERIGGVIVQYWFTIQSIDAIGQLVGYSGNDGNKLNYLNPVWSICRTGFVSQSQHRIYNHLLG